MIDVTRMRIAVETIVAARPEAVWDLVADITRVPQWSPEVIRTAWLEDATAPRPGARFRGRNRAPNGFEWNVTCVVGEASRPRTFAWVVLADPADPSVVSSFWRCELELADPGATRVRESFTHGPGQSGLRWMMEQDPARAAELMEDRRRGLQENMLATLAGMKAAAETGRS